MEVIKKPWGSETILEKNDHYVVKLLKMFQGHKCSLQYHEKKLETIYVLYGVMKLQINNEFYTYKSGESFTILPNTIHRMIADTYIEYLETSTTELDDVIRVEDDYERC